MKKISLLITVITLLFSIGLNAQKVSNYAVSATALSKDDLFDLSKFLGGSVYESQKLTYEVLTDELSLDLPTLYTANGALASNRTVTMGGYTLNFNGGNVGIGVSPNNTFQVVDLINFDIVGNDNCFIGYKAGDVTAVKGNTFIGSQAGTANTTGLSNTFVGANAGISVVTGNQCTFIGANSGGSNAADYNTFIGYSAGSSNTSGVENTTLGHSSLAFNQAGSNNTSIGYNAGKGTGANDYSDNTLIGNISGLVITTGSNNTFLGSGTGDLITTGSDNVFIGMDAGNAYTTETDLLEISSSGSILIEGDFSANKLELHGGRFNDITTVNAATYDLLVSDYILNVTYTATAAVTSLTLPTAQTVVGRTIIIKDSGGSAGGNNITIDTEGAETIDGAATTVISVNYEGRELYCDGSNWFIIK